MGLFGGSYAGPKEVHYLFVDGEQLRCTADEVGKEWFGEPIDIDYRLLQGGCQKVFYYDCLPANSHVGDQAEFVKKHAAKLEFFNQLRSIPGWHVSEGLARHRKKARQEQKEVDILIAVDMLTHTHRKNMHRLTFVSGDQDFAPLLEAVVRDGMYVELLYPLGHTSQDLIHFADVAKPMDVDYLHSISTRAFKQRNTLPDRSGELSSHPLNGVVIGEGFVSGGSFAKVWRQQAEGTFDIRLLQINSSNHYLSVRGLDMQRAIRYFANWMERDLGIPSDSIEWRMHP